MTVTHYFWCLCPDDVEQGDTCTLELDEVTCPACLKEMEQLIAQASPKE